MDFEADAVHGVVETLVLDHQVLDRQHYPFGLSRLLVHHQVNGTADHQLGQRLAGGLTGDRLPDDLPPSQDRDPIGDLEHLPQLVGDEDDPLARLLETPHDPEEVVHLLRGQHRGRLVEDDDLRLPEQHLDDLDPLLDPDREILDDGVGIDRQPILR